MSNIEKKKIMKLALKKGTPLLVVNRWGKAAVFVYKEGSRTKGYSYNTIEKGVRGEIKRLGG